MGSKARIMRPRRKYARWRTGRLIHDSSIERGFDIDTRIDIGGLESTWWSADQTEQLSPIHGSNRERIRILSRSSVVRRPLYRGDRCPDRRQTFIMNVTTPGMRSTDTTVDRQEFAGFIRFAFALGVLWSVVSSVLWYANISSFFTWYAVLYILFLVLAEFTSSSDLLSDQQRWLRGMIAIGFLGWIVILIGYIGGWL